MAEGLNRVMLFGNLGADPELRTTAGGQSVLKLRVATAESYLDRDKQRQYRTEWHSVVVWGKRAEALARFLRKGSSVFVEGSLRTSSYEKDGQKRYKTEVNATNIILGSKATGERQESAPAESGVQTAGGGYSDAEYGGESDYPF